MRGSFCQFFLATGLPISAPSKVTKDATDKAPWLSVLVPVYNGAETLEECLNSLAQQAFGVEIVAVDQGSTDKSKSILRSFSGKLDIRIIDAPQNENWVQNTNLALREARAPLATLLHQDDIWLPGRAKLLKEMSAEHPDAALWLHSAFYINSHSSKVGTFAPPFGKRPAKIPSQKALARILVQNTVALPAAMFPTALARDLGGLDEELWYSCDWDFWIKLAASGPVAWSPKNAAAFRIHGSSQTIRGSRDLDDFRRQLAAPLDRHLTKLPAQNRESTEKLALASNALNVWLAASYHRTKQPIRPLLGQLIKLGPSLWWPFLRDSRIIQRVLPRLLQLLKTRT